jgi:hypothetical protein
MAARYKLIVNVPAEHADRIRNLLGELGCGRFDNYEYASFSSRGVGRFRPLEGADPERGRIGEIEEVEEEKIEVVVGTDKLKKVLREVKEAHPYEEPAMEVIKLEDF